MERQFKIGIAAFALVVGALAVASTGGTGWHGKSGQKQVSAANLRLATLSTSSRRDVDYALLDSRLKRLVEKPTMVGLAIGIVENGRITFLHGYGETVEGSGDPVTPQTVFRWASVSKGVAATMTAKLAEQGKVNLDAPIATYNTSLRLPGGNERVATLGDVLSHRLGIYRNAWDDKLEAGEDPHLIRQSLATLSSVCAPHSCWSYQNVAYDTSSEVISRVTGKPYQEEVREQLFAPIGMTSASVTKEGLENSKSWARPHSVGRRPLEVSDAYYKVPAAGGVNSNIKDMALWMIAQMGEMPDVLSPRVLNTIHAPLVSTPGERGRLRKFAERVRDPYYGYGWRSYDYAGHHIVGHRGGVNGYRSLILFDPKLKSGVVALWNSNTSQPGGLEFEVMDMLYHLPFRDWMEVDSSGAPVPDADDQVSSGDSGDRRRG
ncbi:serine hydrolase domain-containing protein [Sphingomonas alba]|uniref:Beta-lactamase family protein n=1 Tax=Sphingomonas alba TaxID=2908208 RepID=A0ABT0RQI5_9SPHN|nr:serine hydrolase domain-containing protein [Sphingomonas alba]MCL6684554.1 beta-lactamase family protein [Sphingomonas alba]